MDDTNLTDEPAADGAPESPATDATKAPSSERLTAYLNQVLLRAFNASPGLASYIESYRVIPGAIELSFYHLPDEVVSSVMQVFSVGDVEQFRYTKHAHPCTGFRAKPTAEELASLAVDDEEDHQVLDQIDGEGNTQVEVAADKLLQSPDSTTGQRAAPPL